MVEGHMQDVEHNKKIARKFIEGVAANNVNQMMDCVHEEGFIETMGNTLISGAASKKDVRSKAADIVGAFPTGLKMDITNLIGENDTVAIEVAGTGVHSSGKQYNNRYHFLMRYKDGKIIWMKEYLDTELVTEVLCGGQRPAKK